MLRASALFSVRPVRSHFIHLEGIDFNFNSVQGVESPFVGRSLRSFLRWIFSFLNSDFLKDFLGEFGGIFFRKWILGGFFFWRVLTVFKQFGAIFKGFFSKMDSWGIL